jgi:hypothetical protein
MGDEILYFIEVTTGGLLAGIMYSLVALGFVLIFKASGIFNFAQGVMALFAALTLVGLMEKLGVPAWVAIVMTIGVMIVLAWLIERLVLQHLVNQDPIILFMATIGLAYVLEGVGDLMWGSDVKVLNVGLPDGAVDWMFDLGIYVTKLELVAAATAATMVAVLAVFFQKTRILSENADRPGPARRGGRPSGRAVGRHFVAHHMGHRLVGLRHRGAGCWHHVGEQFRRSVFAVIDRAEGASSTDSWGFHLYPRRHSRRIDYRRRREMGGNLSRRLYRPRHRELVRLCAGARLPAGSAAGLVRRKDYRKGLT